MSEIPNFFVCFGALFLYFSVCLHNVAHDITRQSYASVCNVSLLYTDKFTIQLFFRQGIGRSLLVIPYACQWSSPRLLNYTT